MIENGAPVMKACRGSLLSPSQGAYEEKINVMKQIQ